MTTAFNRALMALTAIVITLFGTVVAATPAVSSTSQPTIPVLTNIRTGLNTGFDRVVLDMSGPQPTVRHQVLDELTEDASGEIFWLTGESFIQVVAEPAAAHDDNGNSTYTGPRKFRTRNLRNVMAVGINGDFEANLSVGLGVRYQSWVRVFTLTAPTRVIIDVGH